MSRVEKEVVIRRKEVVVTCDICGKTAPSGKYSVCSVCKRDVCVSCFKDCSEISDKAYIIPCPVCRGMPDVKDRVAIIDNLYQHEDDTREQRYVAVDEWGKESQKCKILPGGKVDYGSA